jgi:copper chaperone NosL
MMRRPAALGLSLLLAVGCARRAGEGPPAVHFGEDACARCGMIVSDPAFAAAVVTEIDGLRDALVFDDVGCLFAWEAGAAKPSVARWVSAHDGSGWLRAETAWYVRSAAITSPMGSGVAALADRASAQRLSRERGGVLLDWNGLSDLGRERGLLAPPPLGHET